MAMTMRAVVVPHLGAAPELREVPRPDVGDRQILVKIAASGLCHTDLHAADGDWPIKPSPPFIPGHEGVGTVVAAGRGVRGVKEGDRVGVPWLYSACGHCEYCLSGWETLCGEQSNTGYSVNGGHAEYALADPDFVGHLPPNVGFADIAPILCAGVTVYKGLKETDTRPGQWVLISGVGGLGHCAIQYAKAMGLHVAAVDIDADKLALAREVGAEVCIDASSGDPAAEIRKATGGVHGALVTAVSSTAFRQALDALRPHGTLSIVGLPPGSFDAPIFDIVVKRLTVRGSIVGTRADLHEALAFAAEGKVHAIIEERPLDAAPGAFADLRAGRVHGRIVLIP